MTPQLARLALGGFACLAAGVAFNAMVLQGGGVRVAVEPRQTQPQAPREIESTAWLPNRPARKATERRTGPFEANAMKLDNPPEPGATDGRPDTIRAIQRELRNRGYGPIAVDGDPGLATRAAIMAFETDEGLPLTAIANETTLKSILLGAAQPAGAAERAPSARAQEVIRATQNWLLALGYQPGPANGLMSPATQGAIKAFEASVGLPQRGRIAADVVTRLAETVPLKSPVR